MPDIEQLIDLSDLITRQKTQKAELIDEAQSGHSKMATLYQAMAKGKIQNETDAIELLGYDDPKNRTYNNLKNRLYDRMINSVFFIDQSGPNYKDIFVAAKTCYKNYAACRLLYGNRKGKTAIELAEKSLKVSIKYEFTELNYLFCSLLTSYYLTRMIKTKKSHIYSDLKNHYRFILFEEDQMEEIKIRLGNEISKTSGGVKKEILEKFKKKIPQILQKQKQIKSLRFNLSAFLFQANLYLETSEYDNLLRIALKGVDFLKSKSYDSLIAEYTLTSRAGLGYFLTKKYKESENIFNRNLSITGPKSGNYYATLNFLFSLYVVQKKYNDAFICTSRVFKEKAFEEIILPLLIQLWKVKEAYTHFLVDLGKIDPDNIEDHSMRKFRLGRFLNDIPSYSKDKRGVNISILVIQLILLVQTKKYDQIIDKLDALNMYCHRYLRADKTFRSNCFIKMLMKLPDADYHPIRWARYVKKLRNKLEEHPFEFSYHNLDLEVIPYEHLYDLVIEMLEKQKGLFRTAP